MASRRADSARTQAINPTPTALPQNLVLYFRHPSRYSQLRVPLLERLVPGAEDAPAAGATSAGGPGTVEQPGRNQVAPLPPATPADLPGDARLEPAGGAAALEQLRKE